MEKDSFVEYTIEYEEGGAKELTMTRADAVCALEGLKMPSGFFPQLLTIAFYFIH